MQTAASISEEEVYERYTIEELQDKVTYRLCTATIDKSAQRPLRPAEPSAGQRFSREEELHDACYIGASPSWG